MPAVTLADVAARAGVSPKTVSNVVNGRPHVSEAMRRRVTAAVEELGYRPNAAARRLVTGRTNMIALAIPVIDVPYFADLAARVSDAAEARGYRVLIQQTRGDGDLERAAVDVSELGLVDGVLLQPEALSGAEIEEAAARHPLGLLGEGDAPSSLDRVMIDNVAAAVDATRHLLALGRRRIAFLGREREPLSAATSERLEGYRRAMADAGAVPGPVIELEGFGPGTAAGALGDALASGVSVDAVLCRDDGVAFGALRALRAAGLRVPEDVAVIGWDDDRGDAFLETSLTTVRPDKRAIAAVALANLIDRIEGYDGEGRHVVVPHTIVVRESAPSPEV